MTGGGRVAEGVALLISERALEENDCQGIAKNCTMAGRLGLGAAARCSRVMPPRLKLRYLLPLLGGDDCTALAVALTVGADRRSNEFAMPLSYGLAAAPHRGCDVAVHDSHVVGRCTDTGLPPSSSSLLPSRVLYTQWTRNAMAEDC